MRVLDLFSGIGGFSLGLERAGMHTVAFCEIEPFCRAVLRKHWPGVPIFEDIRSLHAAALPAGIDVVCGGFPCQDISLAGKGAGLAGTRSGLWSEFHRLVGEVRPQFAIIENVSALRSRGLDAVLGSLAEIGYDAQWHCIPAAAVGAPHRRDRIWIVAYPTQQQPGEAGQLRHNKPAERATSSSQACCAVADASGERLEAGRQIPLSAIALQSLLASSGNHRAVAGPDEPQWEWEKPRLVERPMGVATDGVSARLLRNANAATLRALGNSVVPQIPEIIGRAIMNLTEQEARRIAQGGK